MKKLIVLVVAIIILASLTACSRYESAESVGNSFVKVDSYLNFTVVYDKDTLVMYTVSHGYNNGGNLTMLVDADGNPKLYKGER